MQLGRRLSLMRLARRLSNPQEAHIREQHSSDKTARFDLRSAFVGILLDRPFLVLCSCMHLEEGRDQLQLLVEVLERDVVAVHNLGAPLQELPPGLLREVFREDQPPSRLKSREKVVRLSDQTRKVNDAEHAAVEGGTLVRNKRRFLHNLAFLYTRRRPARVCKHRDEAGVEAVES
jgi:hypothetical protein